MDRQLKGKYLLAGFITVIIFLLGMFLGLVIEGKRAELISSVAQEQKLSYGSLQLQYQLVSELGQGENNCPAISATFEEYMKELVKAEERLDKYEKEASMNKETFTMLKQEYTQAEINYWLLAKKAKEVCSRDFATILFFYSPEERCPRCNDQSFVLTYLKQLLKDKVLIFSFDSTLDREPLIKIFKNMYNLTEYPAMVIDGKAVQGFYDKEDVLKQICPNFKEKPEGC